MSLWGNIRLCGDCDLIDGDHRLMFAYTNFQENSNHESASLPSEVKSYVFHYARLGSKEESRKISEYYRLYALLQFLLTTVKKGELNKLLIDVRIANGKSGPRV